MIIIIHFPAYREPCKASLTAAAASPPAIANKGDEHAQLE
jgi:hypothetical protein